LAITANGTAPYGIAFQGRNNNGGGPSGTSYPIIFNPLGGNVGIGTTTPSDKLTVEGNISIGSTYKIYNGSAADSAGLYFSNNQVNISGFSGIIFRSSATNVLDQTERMRITSGGSVGIGTSSPAAALHIVGNEYIGKSGGGGQYKQTVVGQTTAAASGSSKKIAYVGFTHSVRVYVWANQSTDNGSTAIADIVTLYGSSNGGVVMESNFGNVSDISITYDNGGSPAYTINVTLTYSGAAPTINYVIEGISHDNNIYTI
jgi:hypothetical protein